MLADIDGLKAGSESAEERDLDVVGVILGGVDLVGKEEERGDGSSSHGALHGSLGGLLELADIVRVAVNGASGGEDEAAAGNGLVGDDGEGAAKGLIDSSVRGDGGEGGEEDGADGGVDGDDGVVVGGGSEVGLGGSDDLWQGESHDVWGLCLRTKKRTKTKETSEVPFLFVQPCFSRPVSGWNRVREREQGQGFFFYAAVSGAVGAGGEVE